MSGQSRRLVVLEEDVIAIKQLARELEGHPWLRFCGHTTHIAQLGELIQAHQPDVVLIDGPFHAEMIPPLQQLRMRWPHITFIAGCSPRELHWEPFFRNMGMWVLTKPIQINQLAFLLLQPGAYSTSHPVCQAPSSFFSPEHPVGQQVSGERHTRLPSGSAKHLITVYGPKGGVGKTFLSRELAIFFAMQKQNGRPLKVLAIDFNLDLGTIATSLNLPRLPNLYHWVRDIDQRLAELMGKEGYDPRELADPVREEFILSLRLSPAEITNYIVVHEESNLHVLTSPRDLRQSFEIRDYHLYLILETLKQSDYDIILIDTAPDTTDATIQAIFFAQHVLMVGNPVVDAIDNIQRMLKLLREAEYPEERIQLCINRLQRKEMFTLEEIRAYFQLHPTKVIYSVPDDPEVKRSINTGVPLMLQTVRSSAKEAIEQIARALVPLPEPLAQESGGPKKQKGLGLFGWLRKQERV